MPRGDRYLAERVERVHRHPQVGVGLADGALTCLEQVRRRCGRISRRSRDATQTALRYCFPAGILQVTAECERVLEPCGGGSPLAGL